MKKLDIFLFLCSVGGTLQLVMMTACFKGAISPELAFGLSVFFVSIPLLYGWFFMDEK